jgi:hypothetical protein
MLARFLSQFNNLLIYVLLGSAVVTALLQHWVDTGHPRGGADQCGLRIRAGRPCREGTGRREGHGFQSPNVLRDGLAHGGAGRGTCRRRLRAARLAIASWPICGAARASSLKLDEAMLTGESVAVDKSADPVAVDAALGDRFSMAYSGTLVAAGKAWAWWWPPGPRTELGLISTMLGSVQTLATR